MPGNGQIKVCNQFRDARRVGRGRTAFTLVELLVVIGVIALLIGILLPALVRARRAADTAYCLANLRTIGQAMTMYTSQFSGWLPGSGWTTGAMFWDFTAYPPVPAKGFSVSYSPALNEPNDWIAPLSRLAGYHDDPAINGNDDVARYQRYRTIPFLTCPGYRSMAMGASPKSDADAGIGPGISYTTSLAFLDKAWETFSQTNDTQLDGNLVIPADGTGVHGFITLPLSYGPRITMVGDSSRKVFAADGSRALIPIASGGIEVQQPPAYVISATMGTTNWDNTVFADYGAFGGWSHSACRTAVAGNATHLPAADLRIWAYRHGATSGFQGNGQYRMNAVFFDGHAETMDEVKAANPALWMPRGSVIYPKSGATGTVVAGTKTVWTDVVEKYCPGLSSGSDPWISP